MVELLLGDETLLSIDAVVTNLKLVTSPCFLPLIRSLQPLILMSLRSTPELINFHRSDKSAASIFLSSGFISGLINIPLGTLDLFYSAMSASKACASLTSIGCGLGLVGLYLPKRKQSLVE